MPNMSSTCRSRPPASMASYSRMRAGTSRLARPPGAWLSQLQLPDGTIIPALVQQPRFRVCCIQLLERRPIDTPGNSGHQLAGQRAARPSDSLREGVHLPAKIDHAQYHLSSVGATVTDASSSKRAIRPANNDRRILDSRIIWLDGEGLTSAEAERPGWEPPEAPPSVAQKHCLALQP